MDRTFNGSAAKRFQLWLISGPVGLTVSVLLDLGSYGAQRLAERRSNRRT